jgi:hypothetical protein
VIDNHSTLNHCAIGKHADDWLSAIFGDAGGEQEAGAVGAADQVSVLDFETEWQCQASLIHATFHLECVGGSGGELIGNRHGEDGGAAVEMLKKINCWIIKNSDGFDSVC